ncbi:MAG TPA: alpha/beta fold hydrolase [Chloroflexia bacterium]|nr:alpha/beta fold hydrolase [Chloroflexia bacterium]
MQTPTDLVYLEAPPRVSGAATPPLLIMLHGVGSHEGDLLGLAPMLDPRFHTVSLRAPYTLDRGSYAWFHVEFTPDGPHHNPEDAEASRELLVDTIPALVAATGTDPDQVYLLGFSQGAIMALFLALTDPTSVAGAVMMSGRTLPEVRTRLGLPVDLAKLAVLVVHGTRDSKLGIQYARETRNFIATLPVALEYHEYAMGHEVSQESLAEVAAWLTARLDEGPRLADADAAEADPSASA